MSVTTGDAPMAAAVYALLQDATLQAAVNGQIGGDIAQDTPFPYVWIEIFDVTNDGGFGTGNLPKVEIRTHTFSAALTAGESQEINRQVVALMKDATLVIAGLTPCGRVVWTDTKALNDQLVNGRKCREVVSFFTAWAEE